MQFRRHILCGVLAAVAPLVLYLLIGFFAHDTILVRSTKGEATIVVRKVFPGSFWSGPLSLLTCDSPQHRFDYCLDSRLWTCESYTADSYSARSASVEWDSKGAVATVSLDGRPVFVCRQGRWTAIKSR
jgi:hypothetical protein